MSDVSVRDAARRFAASGAVDDEARLLRERLRAGRLKLERLRLCAYLGHDAARRVLGPTSPPPVFLAALSDRVVPRAWKRSMRSAPKRELVLALLSVVENARQLTTQARPWTGPPEVVVDDVLLALRGWLLGEAGAGRAELFALSRAILPWSAVDRADHVRRRHLRRSAYWTVEVATDRGNRCGSWAWYALVDAAALAGDWTPIEATFKRTLTSGLLS